MHNPELPNDFADPLGCRRFTIGEHEVRAMQEWSVGGARPCVLGVVTADNDYAFASAPGDPTWLPPETTWPSGPSRSFLTTSDEGEKIPVSEKIPASLRSN
jgi:hypothetical protein